MTVEEIKAIYMSSRSLRQAAWKARIEHKEMRELRRFYGWPILKNCKPRPPQIPHLVKQKKPRTIVMSIYEAVLTG